MSNAEERAAACQRHILDSIERYGQAEVSIHYLREAFPPEYPDYSATERLLMQIALSADGHGSLMSGEDRFRTWLIQNNLRAENDYRNHFVVLTRLAPAAPESP